MLVQKNARLPACYKQGNLLKIIIIAMLLLVAKFIVNNYVYNYDELYVTNERTKMNDLQWAIYEKWAPAQLNEGVL